MSEQLPDTAAFPPPHGGRRPDLLVVAGEHSGDEHAALMVADLLRERPGLRVACLGGERLRAAGAQLLYDLTAVSVVGLVEVLRHYGFFRALFERVLEWIAAHRPRHICFVDYPGFNLRLAAQLRRRGLSRRGGGAIGTSYYIGPQIWAWKAKRRFRMAETLDRVGVIFPFEAECYGDTDLDVTFVGHPFVREGVSLPFRHDPEAPVLLLPGSRRAAVRRIFPVLLRALRAARAGGTALTARVVYPGPAIRGELEAVAGAFEGVPELLEYVPNTAREVGGSAVLMSSGTMSLACALSGIPGGIVYRLNPLSYWLGRMLVDVPYIGISNLLLNRPLHPEFIQGAAAPQKLAGVLCRAATDPAAAREAADGAAELRELLRPGEKASAAEWLLRGLAGDAPESGAVPQ